MFGYLLNTQINFYSRKINSVNKTVSRSISLLRVVKQELDDANKFVIQACEQLAEKRRKLHFSSSEYALKLPFDVATPSVATNTRHRREKHSAVYQSVKRMFVTAQD